jgi:lysozyme family protein
MADVHKAWAFVLSNEDATPPTGNVVAEPNGGRARLGINSIAHPEALARGFYSMPLDQALEFAEDIFKYDYWSRILGYSIESQVIASKWADITFNMNAHEATLLVQRAVNSLRLKPIRVDGVCGPDTIASVNTYLDAEDEERLYAAIIKQGAMFYEELRQEHPERYSEALEQEWLRRLNKRPPA